MAFFTLNGQEYEVLITDAEETEPDEIGERFRAFDGTLRATVRAEARNWRFGILFQTQTQYQALRDLIKSAAEVTLGGDCVDNVDVICLAKMSARYLNAAGTGFYRMPIINLTEVTPT